jgi:uncharacterized membrane protein
MQQHAGSARLFPLDALRGLLMVLMALDHANYFIARQHSAGEYWGGPFPVYPDATAFLARLVTHLAAPGFFFLMGAGMLLLARARRAAGWSRWAVARFFLLRGALLIALKLLVVNRAWGLYGGGWGYIGVLFALGACMLLGAALVWLRPGYLLALSAALALAVEWLTPDPGRWGQALPALARVLFIPGPGRALWVNYPVLPWLGLAALGMAFGGWLAGDAQRAWRRALWLGAAMLLTFLALRGLDGFGNLRPRAGETWIDFLNTVKYPPSLVFTLMTMGPNLILLGLLARAGERLQRVLQPLVVLGQAPLFFYVSHLFPYAGLGLGLAPGGTSIPGMLPYWLLGLLLLLPLCWWYGRLKQRQPAHSILRLF